MARPKTRRPRSERRTPVRRGASPRERSTSSWGLFSTARLVAWLALTGTVFVMIGMAMEHEVTWYLAVDQFGYFRFAHDLLDGKIFHDWPPATALRGVLPARTDMLAQTYVWEDGQLYSRYAPGFPLILATWILLFGDTAAHYLNLSLYLGLLALVIAFQWELHRSLWRGGAVVGLIYLCPTFVRLWGLTPTRDMSAHVFAFTGLVLLLARFRPPSWRRILAAGCCIGFAGSIRPDAVLYLLPAGIIATWRWARTVGGWGTLRRLGAVGAIGVAIGLAPSMLFYAAATGNPLVPTQGMELKRLFSRALPTIVTPAVAASERTTIGFPSPGWHGGTVSDVQGGGLRLANLPSTLRGNLQKIRYGYGRVLLGVAVWGAVVTVIVRPMFAAATLSYLGLALLFFSCWTRPDSRYLIGVWVLIPMYIVEGLVGTLDLVRWLWRRQRHELARAVAVAAGVGLLAGYALFGPQTGDWREGSLMPLATAALVAAGTLASVAAAIWTRRRIALVVAPLLMITTAAFALAQADRRMNNRASFQRPQAERARSVFRASVVPNAVVITSEDVGRPMENIEYYADIHALYLTDLTRWRIEVATAARVLISEGLRPYLLLQRRTAAALMPSLRDGGISAELVADIPPTRNYDYFVAAAFHRGLPMQLWKLSWPKGEAMMKQLDSVRRARPPARPAD